MISIKDETLILKGDKEMARKFCGNDLKDVYFHAIGKSFKEARMKMPSFEVAKSLNDAIEWISYTSGDSYFINPDIDDKDRLYVWNHPDDSDDYDRIIYDWVYAKEAINVGKPISWG